ncbi:peptidoglycan-binding protein [Roseomonas hellenica]|uniref:Peptidoglycan-binding protein n=1 Tax=Plastoroseomonas hellenica TaxID=2687306 RepID=A0ABS5F341_9PROT|nr:peptidoglycan-binding domain-containing protein [Plastoroseomonas hellenica]MBR0666989.1 peptidoglycan-binding protein [Plastoroseomonas hellenica]
MTPVKNVLAGLILAAPLLASPASAQPVSGLSYVQPLAPPALMQVQERLRQAGDYTGRADGVWGPDSQAALQRFQQRNGLQATGQLNQVTAMTLGLNTGTLLSAGASPAAAAPEAAPGPLSRLAVQNLQARLRNLGFYRGAVDGFWGPGTQAAIERFQQGHGLQPTGQLNPATAQAMGLDPNNLEGPVR